MKCSVTEAEYDRLNCYEQRNYIWIEDEQKFFYQPVAKRYENKIRMDNASDYDIMQVVERGKVLR